MSKYFFLQRAQELGIPRTVHAGEAGPAASVHEVSEMKYYSKALGQRKNTWVFLFLVEKPR